MNDMDMIESIAAGMDAFNFGKKVIAIIIVYVMIRKLVSVGSQEEQYNKKYGRLKLYLGNLWGALGLIILLYDVGVNVLAQDFPTWLENMTEAAESFCAPILNCPFVQSAWNYLFPIPSTVMGAIGGYQQFFWMLALFFILEAFVHAEIRREMKKWLAARIKRKQAVNAETETSGQSKAGTKKRTAPRWWGKQAGKGRGKPQTPPLLHRELYDYDHELARCFLKEECKWQRIFFQIAVIAVICFHFITGSSVGTIMFPLYAMTEFWMMTAVPTRREFFEKGQGQDGTEERKDRLKRTVDEITDRNGSTIPGVRAPAAFLLNNDAVCAPPIVVDELQKTHEDKLMERYFDLCRKTGVNFDPRLEFPAKELLKGKSVVFSTRFYQDMGYSFYLPMLRVLQSGYHCLVVSGDQIDMRPMEEWLLSGRKHIVGDATVWKLERLGLRGRQNDTDIGYISAEELSDAGIMRENSAFFAKVRLVLIINAASLLHKQLFGIMRLRKLLHQNCAFAICNDNAVGLTDIYSHLLQTDLNLIVPTTARARRSHFIFCDEEDPPGSDVSDCGQIVLGKALLQGGVDTVEKVYWYSSRVTPVKDIASQHGGTQSADEYASPADQAGRLVVGVDDANCPREDFACVIVEDEIYNPAELGMQFASRGREDAVVAIFSPNYFLRNYIRFHFKKFNAEFRKIVQTFPAYCMSERNAILQIMWNMERGRLDEDDIRSICLLLGQRELENDLWPQGYIDHQVLIRKFKQYTNLSDIEYYVHCEHKFVPGRVIYEFWLDPIPCSGYDRRRPCYYVCAALGPEHRILPQYSKVQLMQSYLSGQIVSLAGQSYEVMGIAEDDSAVEMFVRRNAQSLRLRREYQQQREVKIDGTLKDGSSQAYTFSDAESECRLLLKRHTARKMEVTTLGYWTAFPDDSEVPYTRLEDKLCEQTRHLLYEKDFLSVELSGQDSPKDNRQIIQGMAVTLSELFRTVYAEYRCQLLVCYKTSTSEGDFVIENRRWGVIHGDDAKHNCFYIIEDSEEDIGLLDSIMLHFERLLHMITEVDDYYDQNGGTD